MRKIIGGASAAAAAMTMVASCSPAAAEQPVQLSVLTYNIEGLPWPARAHRSADLAKIAAKLQDMRLAGAQPHIVVFEEAFSARAKAIARDAGYRYVADGPAATDAGAPARSPADRAFHAATRFLKGETIGKWRGSGLRIASDYPILSVRRMPYPSFACAGLDCLANKGVLLVTIAVPGVAQPVAVVDTHLNSRKAARVSADRSFYAFQRQVDALSEFVRANVPAGAPLIVAGDFNAGQEERRRSYLLQQAASWRGASPVTAALETCLQPESVCTAADRSDLAFSQHRGRDYQLFASSPSASLTLEGMEAPFGHDSQGRMLSDHVGYAATYRIVQKSEAAQLLAQTVDAGPARLPPGAAIR